MILFAKQDENGDLTVTYKVVVSALSVVVSGLLWAGYHNLTSSLTEMKKDTKESLAEIKRDVKDFNLNYATDKREICNDIEYLKTLIRYPFPVRDEIIKEKSGLKHR